MNLTSFDTPETMKSSYPWFQPDSCRFAPSGAGRQGGVALFRDKGDGRIYYDPADAHTLIYGSRQAARKVMLPTAGILAYAGSSLVIQDSGGRSYDALAGQLQALGYRLAVVNLRSCANGSSWNPLHLPCRAYLRGETEQAAALAEETAHLLMAPEDSVGAGAADLFFGLAMLLLRCCKDRKVSEPAVQLDSLLELRRKLFAGGTAADSSLWEYARQDELAGDSLCAFADGPEHTREAALAWFDRQLRPIRTNGALMELLCSPSLDLADPGREKMAVFLITPEDSGRYQNLAGLFVRQCDHALRRAAERAKAGHPEHPVVFLLDGFDTLPAMADFPETLTAGGAVRYVLSVGSRSRLERRWGAEAQAIADGCHTWMCLESREPALLAQWSGLCGGEAHPNLPVWELQALGSREEALLLQRGKKPAVVPLPDTAVFPNFQLEAPVIPAGERQVAERPDFSESRALAPAGAAEKAPADTQEDLIARINDAWQKMTAPLPTAGADGEPEKTP